MRRWLRWYGRAALNVYITDGRLAIDNNAAERVVKPFAIGRKNGLVFGNDHSGRRLAILSSFTATCQQFDINPWAWLKDTLTRLPSTSADQRATLLPTPARPITHGGDSARIRHLSAAERTR